MSSSRNQVNFRSVEVKYAASEALNHRLEWSKEGEHIGSSRQVEGDFPAMFTIALCLFPRYLALRLRLNLDNSKMAHTGDRAQ